MSAADGKSDGKAKQKSLETLKFQGFQMAEDMGLEEVRKAQALKFQGGITSSTLVPKGVPNVI